MNIAEKTLQLKKDFDDVHEVGFEKGRHEGFETGYEDGRTFGYEEGYEDGRTFGYEEGYEEGQSLVVDKSKIVEKTVSGEVVSLDDVSEIPHKVKVSLTSGGANKLPYPYVDTTKTVNGITFTDNGDGTITAKGSSTGIADFILQEKFLVKQGIYISGIENGSSLTYEIQAYTDSTNIITTNSQDSSICKADFTANHIRLRIRSGVTVNNIVFKPMLSFTPDIPYEPYKETLTDYSGVSLKRCGKNLWPNGDQTFTRYIQGLPVELYKGVTYTFSAVVTSTDTDNNVCLVHDNTNTLNLGSLSREGRSFITFTPAKNIFKLSLYASNNMTNSVDDTATFKNIQIEEGYTATEYEPYKEQTITANADGTVEGITSTSPYMYLTTDNENVTINVTYHKSYGMQMEYDRFWDSYQDYGNKTDYGSVFSGNSWNDNNYKPKYSIGSPTAYNELFRFSNITDIKQELDLTKNANSNLVFNSCVKLVRIPKIKVNENNVFTNWFDFCNALEEIRFEGTIGKTIAFSQSTKLSKASILNIFSVLSSTVTGQTLTLPTAAVTNAFGGTTATEWTNLVATRTNWTISLV